MTKPSTLRTALGLLSVRLVLQQIGLALVVFLTDCKAGEEERELTIAKVAKAAWDYYSKK